MKALLEVVILPVYRDRVGFGLDVDYAPAPSFRVIQLTPEGSSTSIQIGVCVTDSRDGQWAGGYVPGVDPDGNGWVLQERGHR
ncbi:hypothetical protein A5724_09750 [Mycobacterium sp. ACS1612]|uniref:hypothetical protein n=1 Tax=Mycobacterium sp. ACS1612 TaxID=1834117 RepID=UPI0007FC1FE6|nr:hypothetical protein [Mycobacterium sp. ACS1612]OBF38022.1 hypothetical protein A5724_09750 [Mycobacterium sp. ACS1612]